MKKQIIFFTLLLSFLNIFFSTAQDSIRIQDCLMVYRVDDAQWMRRYQKNIDNYIDENKKLDDKSCDILIFGSSSINKWDNIYIDLAPLKIIRRSYGGATIRDMIYNYDIIVRGYNPKSIVLYVENDISSEITIGAIYDLFRVFITKVKRDYPQIPFYIISLKPSPLREPLLNKIHILNSLLEDYAKVTEGVNYIDITKKMFDNSGDVRKDIFLEDKLHMNQKGYDIWTSILKPILIQNSKKNVLKY